MGSGGARGSGGLDGPDWGVPKMNGVGGMGAMLSVLRRELWGYFSTPVAYVFILIFLVLGGSLTFADNFGAFFVRNQADLEVFFSFHPWLYLLLIPALSMRLWAEERRGGTIELLMTLPIPTWAAVVGKYLAAWAFTAIALGLTFPLWITVARLGDPDHGAIATSYLGSLLMAGGFLAIGSTVSALTRSQVVAFVVSVVICFGFMIGPLVPGLIEPLFAGYTDSGGGGVMPGWASDALLSFGFLSQFEDLRKGVVDARAVVFFSSLIGCLLAANVVIVETNRA